jgi:hypothetical protein
MIKIWLLLSILHLPGMPTVKHNAELFFDKERCEKRRVVVENKINDTAIQEGINPVFVQTWCLESSMFMWKGS